MLSCCPSVFDYLNTRTDIVILGGPTDSRTLLPLTSVSQLSLVNTSSQHRNLGQKDTKRIFITISTIVVSTFITFVML